ncbi:MAG: hypothetical protein JXB88_01705 [Spirochaetales bacterium]|nr:hypothetical protein [Spirochaetales bacterium]
MGKTVTSFDELTSFIQSFGIEETESIHIAENFMDKNNINFDADGNFDAINVDFAADTKVVNKC